MHGLGDVQGRARVQMRLDRIERGLFGDVKPVGEGVSKLRIDYGLGYRVYLVQRGQVIVLCGGDKGTQSRDIIAAKAMAADWKKRTMALKTTAYDTADYLDSQAAIVAYLQVAFKEGDAADIRAALSNVARARGMTGLSKETDVAREALYKALGKDGNPTLDTLLAVTRALGIKLSVAA